MEPAQFSHDEPPLSSMPVFRWLSLAAVGIVIAILALIMSGRATETTMTDQEWNRWTANALPQHMQDEIKPAVEELKEYQQWRSQEAARHAKAVKSARCKAKADNYADALNSCGVQASQMGRDPLVACAHILNRFTGDAIQGQFSDC